MIVHDVEQRSEEWYRLRAGKFTGSRIDDIMPDPAGKYTAARKNYLTEIMIERMTGEAYEGFSSKPMEWGREQEEAADGLYMMRRRVIVRSVGFVVHEELPNVGVSPDGLVDPDGGVEVKCPNSAQHVKLLTGGKISKQYYSQIQLNLDVCERSWWDYISYDPRMRDERFVLWIHRVERNDVYIKKMHYEIAKAEADVQEMLAKMNEYAESLT